MSNGGNISGEELIGMVENLIGFLNIDQTLIIKVKF